MTHTPSLRHASTALVLLAAVLLTAACSSQAPAASSAVPTRSPAPAATAVAIATPTRAPTAVTPTAAASGAPTSAPTPGPLTGQSQVITIEPRDYHEARIRGDATIEVLPDGSVKVVSTRNSANDQYVEWIVEPASVLPAGAQAATVVTTVCGSGEGDWWEVYGPYGSEEFEFEVTPPGPDGCWHFHEVGRYTDFRVEIWLSGNATMTISSITFHVTFA